MPDAPHPLELYRLSVQHPLAEVAFVDRAWEHYRGDTESPMLLREDFAGTCTLAAAWVRSDPDRQAMAIEIDAPTARWAADHVADCPRCAEDLHIVVDDVMAVAEPATDVTLALNFSTLIYHEESDLLAYLQHARRCLADDGLLILDLFGVDGRTAVGEQSRTITPDDQALHTPCSLEPFTYTWEQRSYDPATRRIDCRIHFTLADGTRLYDAFVYDWRLWRMGEVLGLMREAGFAAAEAWGQPGPTAEGGPTDGRFVLLDGEPGAGDWVSYLVGAC